MTPEVRQQLTDRLARINAANAAAGLPPFTYKTIPQGAATSVWAGVVAPADEVGGRYCEDCHVAELVEGAEVIGRRPRLRARSRARQGALGQERGDGRGAVLK